MTTLGAALPLMRANIEAAIIAIAPTIRGDYKFRALETSRTGSVTIDDFEGAVRLFHVGRWTETRVHSFGCPTNDVEGEIDVTIWYPRGQEWTDAAASDFQQIRSALYSQAGIPDGAAFRFVDSDAFEEPEDLDNSQKLTVRVRARFDVGPT